MEIGVCLRSLLKRPDVVVSGRLFPFVPRPDPLSLFLMFTTTQNQERWTSQSTQECSSLYPAEHQSITKAVACCYKPSSE